MKIKYEEKTRKKLDEIQKRCKVRTIYFSDITDILAKVERCMEYAGFPKKDWDKVSVFYDKNAQEFPKAYNYTPESTTITCDYSNGSWGVEIERSACCTTEIYFTPKDDTFKNFNRIFNMYCNIERKTDSIKEIKEAYKELSAFCKQNDDNFSNYNIVKHFENIMFWSR